MIPYRSPVIAALEKMWREEDLRMARELQMALLPQRYPTLPRGAAQAASAVKASPAGSID